MRYTKAILDCGWNEEVEKILFNRKVGTQVTNKEADVLIPVFTNMVDMIWRKHISKTVGFVDDAEIRKDALSYLFAYQIPMFDRKKYFGKPENYFVLCIRRYFIQMVYKRHKEMKQCVSFEHLIETSENQEEPQLFIHPQYDNDNQTDFAMWDKQVELLNEMFEWYGVKYKNTTNPTFIKYSKILNAMKSILESSPELSFNSVGDDPEGRFVLNRTIAKLADLRGADKTKLGLDNIGNIFRRLMVYFIRDKYDIPLQNVSEVSSKDTKNLLRKFLESRLPE